MKWIKDFAVRIEKWFTTTLRAFQSKTVVSAVSGFAIHYAVRKNWIPDVFFTNALEGLSYVLCAVFRITATTDIKSGNALTPPPNPGGSL